MKYQHSSTTNTISDTRNDLTRIKRILETQKRLKRFKLSKEEIRRRNKGISESEFGKRHSIAYPTK